MFKAERGGEAFAEGVTHPHANSVLRSFQETPKPEDKQKRKKKKSRKFLAENEMAFHFINEPALNLKGECV